MNSARGLSHTLPCAIMYIPPGRAVMGVTLKLYLGVGGWREVCH